LFGNPLDAVVPVPKELPFRKIATAFDAVLLNKISPDELVFEALTVTAPTVWLILAVAVSSGDVTRSANSTAFVAS